MTKRFGLMKASASLAGILLLGGCGALGQQPTLVGSWLTEDIGGQGVVDRAQSTVEFDGEGGVFSSSGCNRFNGPVTIERDALRVSLLITNRRACAPALMDQEDKFLIALYAVRSYRFDGPFLLMEDEAGEEVLRFTRLE